VLVEVVLLSIVSELLVHEVKEGGNIRNVARSDLFLVDSLVPSVSGPKEVLAHESNVGKVSEMVNEVGLVDLKLSSDILSGVAIKWFNIEFRNFEGLSSKKCDLSSLRELLRYLKYLED